MHGIFQGNNGDKSLMQVNNPHTSLFMQGKYNQSVSDPGKDGYYEKCTDASNSMFTSGVVQPTKANYQLYRRSADLAFILKSLSDFRYQDINFLEVCFKNFGAEAWIKFPPKKIYANGTYKYICCNW